MLHRFKDFTSETFLPRNTQQRDFEMDDLIKQKEVSGEVYIDWRERPVILVRESDKANIPTMATIVKRNPWSASIHFKVKDQLLCEFAFYLHPVFADTKKKNLYEPYKLDNMEILGRFKKYQIVYDENLDKLVENSCKLIYNSEQSSGVKNSLDLKKEILKMAFEKTFFIEKNNLPS